MSYFSYILLKYRYKIILYINTIIIIAKYIIYFKVFTIIVTIFIYISRESNSGFYNNNLFIYFAPKDYSRLIE